jgi:hypothetical protein
MPTVWDATHFLDPFPQRMRHASVPTKVEVLRAIHRMLEAMTSVREPQKRPLNEGVSSFNTLLEQAKEQFRGSDTLRLIEPVGLDASAALIAVRLSMVKRTIDAELARSTEDAS